MKLFDLHCDTLYEATLYNKAIKNNDLYIDLDRGNKFKPWIQCFAIFIPDTTKDEDTRKLYENCYNKYLKEIKPLAHKEFTPIVTIENLKLLCGDIQYLDYLKRCGVKLATLTWNKENELGGGALTNIGISEFGKCAVKRMEELSIIVDVSHASDMLFYDICNISDKPFIASHSNCRTICDNQRNLTDEQIKIIIEKQGLIGINLHKPFIKDKMHVTFNDLEEHIYHILELGGEDIISLGTDFDGADIIKKITSISDIEKLNNFMLKKGYEQKIMNKMMYDNAKHFFDINTSIV